MKKTTLFLILSALIAIHVQSQPYFPEAGQVYRTDVIPRVDITINEDSLQWIYDNVDSDHEFKVPFVYSVGGIVDTFPEVGFCLRGHSSRGSAKKSFKISFNTFTPGGKFYGLEKMNLNGEHNDPSIIRSHLVWNFFSQMKVSGARSNHVEVYINNRYYGLYINVEHEDEEFIDSRFGNNDGNLYKCVYPANLSYLGTNPDEYKNGGYTLKTNEEQDDYSDLINFIHSLSNSTGAQLPQNIEPLFNVNSFLRYLAVEIFTGHWDAYSYGQNNYYLYHNQFTGKFEFIPYDLDNTFGVDWAGTDLGERDIYHWWRDGVALTAKIFDNQTYTDRFSFFMNELITKYADTDAYFPEIDAIKSKIDASAIADTYRPLDWGWSISDYHLSYTDALGGQVHYGLKQYITTRINSIKNQLVLNPIAPIVENVYHNYPQLNQTITVQLDITDDEANPTGKLFYQVNDGAFASVDLVQNTDGKYVANLPGLSDSGVISYYIEATDLSANVTREPSYGEYQITIGKSNSMLRISEFMASNSGAIVDNYGASEDWIELKNTGDVAVSLGNKYLTDDLTNPTKLKLPDVSLEPNEYYIIWADDDREQGINHANFKLGASGESIGLFDSFEVNYAAIDTLNFAEQTADISFGVSNTNIWEAQSFATPGGENGSSDVAYITFRFNMNKQIADGTFDPLTDFIDVAGTFNNWSGTVPVYDGNEDGIYEYTDFGFTTGETIEYKARINSDWDTGEFPDLGGDGNRVYTLASGLNIVEHWFNDEETGTSDNLITESVTMYPNPSNSGDFTIEAPFLIETVNVYNMNGSLVYQKNESESSAMHVPASLTQGMYLVEVVGQDKTNRMKLIVY